MTHKECVVVKLTDAEGVVGWGEAVADYPFYSYESVQTNLHVMKDYLAPVALGSAWRDIGEYRAAIAHVNGHNMAKGGMELAFWDLLGKRSGKSVQELLGGTRERVRVGVSVGIHATPQALLESVAKYLAEGYARVKLKIRPGSDVGFIAAIRNAYPGLLLQADGNSVYALEDAAHLAELDAFDLLLLEQPLGADDIVDHAELAPRLKTPICLDESIHGLGDARKALRLKACSIINIKPGRVSGLSEGKAIHDYCLAREVPVWMGGMLELGIGRAGNVALASLPGFTLAGDISASSRYFARDVITEPFVLNAEDSTLSVPGGPGLGIEVDEDYLRSVTVHRELVAPRSG